MKSRRRVSAISVLLALQQAIFYTKTAGKVIGVLGMDVPGTNGAIIDFGQHKLYFLSAR